MDTDITIQKKSGAENKSSGQNDAGIARSKKGIKENKSKFFIDPAKIFIQSYDKFSDRLKAKKIISIELDPSGFQVVYLSTLYHRYQIKRLGAEPFAYPNMAAIKNDIKSIPRILKRGSIHDSEILLCLSGPEIFIRTITVPELNGNELREAIYWTINKDTFIFSDSDIWDYKIVGKTTLNNKPGLKILTICSHDSFIRTYLELLKSINIQVDRIIAKPVALVSAVKLLLHNEVFEKKNFLIVDIGKANTHFCLCAQGNLVFARTVPLRLDDILINVQAADNSKKSFVETHTDEDEKTQRQSDIVFEIKRSIAYFHSQNGISKPDYIFITGSGCDIEGLDTYLSSQLKMQVLKLKPEFPDNKVTQQVSKSAYLTALGAASSRFNLFKLIPRDIKLAEQYKKYRKFLYGAAALLFSLITIYSLRLNNQLEKQYVSNAKAAKEYHAIKQIDDNYNRLINDIGILSSQMKSFKVLLHTDSGIIDNLKVLSNYTPEDIRLDFAELLLTGSGEIYQLKKQAEDRLHIKGKVYKNYVFADLILSRFMKKLEDQRYYKSVKLIKKVADMEKHMEKQELLFELELKTK
ncbi:MAG: pilus assembly protein PilM [Calditrichaceae bacterium]